MNVLTRNQHCGNTLRRFQEVHIPPLEGLTVVGLQVTVQKKQHSLTDSEAWNMLIVNILSNISLCLSN